MCYEPNDYNNEEPLREFIEWYQNILELGGSMADVIYMNEVGINLHLTCRFGWACRGQRCQQICPTQRDQFLYGGCSWL
jgi:hypothetical protein